MPIVVVCPCGAKLKAPDAAAGKRVKCPKCASPLAVPAAVADFEVIDDDAPPVATPAKKKPMLVDDDLPPTKKLPMAAKRKPQPVEVNEAVDDEEEEAPKKKRRRDDDDDDDDTPKKKGKKGKKGKRDEPKSKLPLILGIGGGVFVLLTVVGIIVGVMMSGGGGPAKGTTQAPPTKPALPPGWSEFKGEGFSVAVPDSIQFKQQEQGPNRPGQPPPGTKTYTNGVQPQPQPNGPPIFAYVVSVGEVPAAAAAEFAKSPEAGWEAMKRQGGGGAQLQNEKTIRAGGVDGRQYTLNAGFVAGIARVVVKDNKVYSWVVMSQVAPAEDAPEVKPFFDTFKIE